MTNLKPHPASSEFPMMDAKRFEELRADIKAHGLRVPIMLCEGMILDGRNRHKACVEAGVNPRFEEFVGNPWAYVWSLNGERRDMTNDQRYLVWKHCHELSERWLAQKQGIKNAADAKRVEAAIGNENAKKKPDAVKNSGRATCPTTSTGKKSDRNVTRKAAAAASETNVGAVKRGDALIAKAPELADKVRTGEMPMAAAMREAKRAELVAKLESVEAREAKAVQGVYDVIVADPPWPMEKIERDVRPNQSEMDYPTMSLEEIGAIEIPAAPDCHIFLWTTQRFLPHAFTVLSKWGARYSCTFVWHKPGGFQPIGLPQFNVEFCLYGRIGTPKFIDTKDFKVCFEAPRAGHSEKPEEFYSMVRRVTAGRRLDLYNRREIEGFDGWGKESA